MVDPSLNAKATAPEPEGRLRLVLRSLVVGLGGALVWAAATVVQDLPAASVVLVLLGPLLSGLALFWRGPSATRGKAIVAGLGLLLVIPFLAVLIILALQVERIT